MDILEGSAVTTESTTYHAFCRAFYQHQLYLKLFSPIFPYSYLANMCPRLHQKQCGWHSREVILPLYPALETPPGVFCPVLGPPT